MISHRHAVVDGKTILYREAASSGTTQMPRSLTTPVTSRWRLIMTKLPEPSAIFLAAS